MKGIIAERILKAYFLEGTLVAIHEYKIAIKGPFTTATLPER